MVNVPERYIPKNLSKNDKRKLKKELLKSRKMYKKGKYYTRKKVKSFKSKKSNHIINTQNIYKLKSIKPSRELVKKTRCSLKTLKKIANKGRGAYYSSGSRPNQTAESWARARLASAITGAKASAVDIKLLREGCKKNSKALKMAEKTLKNMGSRYGSRKVKQVSLKGGERNRIIKCAIKKLADNNYKLIVGRRKYVTKFFNFNYLDNDEFEHIINNLQMPSLCIKISKHQDLFFKIAKNIICKIKSTRNCLFSQEMLIKLQEINNILRDRYNVKLYINTNIISDIQSCNISNLSILDKYDC